MKFTFSSLKKRFMIILSNLSCPFNCISKNSNNMTDVNQYGGGFSEHKDCSKVPLFQPNTMTYPRGANDLESKEVLIKSSSNISQKDFDHREDEKIFYQDNSGKSVVLTNETNVNLIKNHLGGSVKKTKKKVSWALEDKDSNETSSFRVHEGLQDVFSNEKTTTEQDCQEHIVGDQKDKFNLSLQDIFDDLFIKNQKCCLDVSCLETNGPIIRSDILQEGLTPDFDVQGECKDDCTVENIEITEVPDDILKDSLSNDYIIEEVGDSEEDSLEEFLKEERRIQELEEFEANELFCSQNSLDNEPVINLNDNNKIVSTDDKEFKNKIYNMNFKLSFPYWCRSAKQGFCNGYLYPIEEESEELEESEYSESFFDSSDFCKENYEPFSEIRNFQTMMVAAY